MSTSDARDVRNVQKLDTAEIIDGELVTRTIDPCAVNEPSVSLAS